MSGEPEIYFEPFVYTSMATVFGTGYHLVARGKKFSQKHTAEVQHIVERMVLLAQAAESPHVLQAYFSTAKLVALLRCTANLDWQGRPGGYCSGLVAARDKGTVPRDDKGQLLGVALGELPGGSIHALDLAAMPFLSQERLEGFLQARSKQARDELFLEGLQRKVAGNYFRDGDREFFSSRLPQFIALARRIETGETGHFNDSPDTWRTLRLVSLLLPHRLRTELSFLVGARRGLEPVAQLQVWTAEHGAPTNRGPLLADGATAAKKIDAALIEFVRRRLSENRNGEVLPELLQADPQATTIDAFWDDVLHGEKRRQVAHQDKLGETDPAAAAQSLAAAARRQPDRRQFLRSRFEAWKNEPRSFASCMAQLKSRDEEVYLDFAAALADWAREDPPARMSELLAQPLFWREKGSRELWLAVWNDVPLPEPDEATIARLLDFVDPAARQDLLELWLPQQAAAFARSAGFLKIPAAWVKLTEPVRRSLVRAWIEAGRDSQAILFQHDSLFELLEPADVSALEHDGAGAALELRVRNYAQRHELGGLVDLWKTAESESRQRPLALAALAELSAALHKLPAEARADVARAVRREKTEHAAIFQAAVTALKALKKTDAAAYRETMQELAPDLVAEAEPASAPTPVDPAPVGQPGTPPRPKLPLIIGIAALVIAIGGGVWFFGRGRGSQDNDYLVEAELKGK